MLISVPESLVDGIDAMAERLELLEVRVNDLVAENLKQKETIEFLINENMRLTMLRDARRARNAEEKKAES